jgi:acyl carrier protein
MDATYDKLTDIFREVFDDPSITLSPQTTADDIEEWDSLTHINLILMVEHRFNIKFSQKDVMGLLNVGDLAECVRGKI